MNDHKFYINSTTFFLPEPIPKQPLTIEPLPEKSTLLKPKPISKTECCKNGGVSEMCMGLCMDPTGVISRSLPKSWTNACVQFEKTIENCFAVQDVEGNTEMTVLSNSFVYHV